MGSTLALALSFLLRTTSGSKGVKKPLYATDKGFAVARGNDFGGASNSAPAGTFSKAPYSYTLLDAGKVKSAVSSAGATLSF
ncbi:unnamed protein product [Rhizoctonia solani]|uniref:Uncharacterized protein n=1 Tax=Rhizoctonia solani TaxID=456999 RepID=A0A8H3GCD3_9AGAM|nr:unnamed protein product [Rhizoctonia solani]